MSVIPLTDGNLLVLSIFQGKYTLTAHLDRGKGNLQRPLRIN